MTGIYANSIKDKTGTRQLASDSGSAWSWGSGVPSSTIIQVKQSVKTDKESQTGTNTGSTKNQLAFIPAQGGSGHWYCDITTTDSNKVLVCINLSFGVANAGHAVLYALYRSTASDTVIGSSTKLHYGTEPTTDQSAVTGQDTIYSIAGSRSLSAMFLDSPSSGTHYYKIGYGAENGTSVTVNRQGSDVDTGFHASTVSSITVFEVKA